MNDEIKRALAKINVIIIGRLYTIANLIEITSCGMDINGSMANKKYTGKLQGVLCTLEDLNIITHQEYDDLFEYFCNCYREEGENE